MATPATATATAHGSNQQPSRTTSNATMLVASTMHPTTLDTSDRPSSWRRHCISRRACCQCTTTAHLLTGETVHCLTPPLHPPRHTTTAHILAEGMARAGYTANSTCPNIHVLQAPYPGSYKALCDQSNSTFNLLPIQAHHCVHARSIRAHVPKARLWHLCCPTQPWAYQPTYYSLL
jgi:hypothetical protein